MRLGMAKIVEKLAPACQIYADADSINLAQFSVTKMCADLFITDMHNDNSTQEQSAELLLAMCHRHPNLKVFIYAQLLTQKTHTLLKHCLQVSILSDISPFEDVCQGLNIVLSEGRYYNPVVIAEQKNSLDIGGDLKEALTYSEKRVLLLLLDGQSQHQASNSLGRSIKTISAQKWSALRKLGLKSNSEFFSRKDELLEIL